MDAARWYLVVGATGVGKTTVARELALRVGGVRFSIDEWMSALYWMDCPEKDDFPWAIERVRRCEAQMASMAVDLAQVGVSAVLDMGGTQRSQRGEWLGRARAAGVKCELVVVDVPVEERWKRVVERNAGASATFRFVVTREMFDAMEAMWEMPGAKELAVFDGAALGG
jgi:predicted kinase